jgi:hypothetical protein
VADRNFPSFLLFFHFRSILLSSSAPLTRTFANQKIMNNSSSAAEMNREPTSISSRGPFPGPPAPTGAGASVSHSSRSFEEDRAEAQIKKLALPASASEIIEAGPPLARMLSFSDGSKRSRRDSSGGAFTPALLAETISAHLTDLEKVNALLSTELERERIALSEVVCFSRRLQAALEACVNTQGEVEEAALRAVSSVRIKADKENQILRARIEELEVRDTSREYRGDYN